MGRKSQASNLKKRKRLLEETPIQGVEICVHPLKEVPNKDGEISVPNQDPVVNQDWVTNQDPVPPRKRW
ncbi:hypothetical protein vseg_010618 [Gypsophila vaccaria]